MKCIRCLTEECKKKEKICEYCKDVRFFTAKQLKRKSKGLLSRRLDDSYCEQVSLGYLFQRDMMLSTKRNMIKSHILFMMHSLSMPRNLTEEDEKKSQLLKQNNEVVDIVLDSVFQWFGTNVGICEIEGLVKRIRRVEEKHRTFFRSTQDKRGKK